MTSCLTMTISSECWLCRCQRMPHDRHAMHGTGALCARWSAAAAAWLAPHPGHFHVADMSLFICVQGADCGAAGALRDRATAGHLPKVCWLGKGIGCCCPALAQVTLCGQGAGWLTDFYWPVHGPQPVAPPPLTSAPSRSLAASPQHGSPGQVHLAHPAGGDRLWRAAAAAQGGAAALGLAPVGLRPAGMLRGVAWSPSRFYCVPLHLFNQATLAASFPGLRVNEPLCGDRILSDWLLSSDSLFNACPLHSGSCICILK